MPWELDMDAAIRIMWISAALGFVLAVVSAIGEWRGWWDLAGEIGIWIGSLVTVGAALGGVALTAGRRQLSGVAGRIGAVQRGVRDNGAVLRSMDTHLVKLDKLDELDRLDKLDRLDQLDVIQASLDAQTGVMDRQLDVLGAIRDRLGGA